MVTQPGATARAVGGDAVVLDQQALVEDRFERPPHTFHVGGVHGAVGLLHIDPVAHARGHGFKRINVTFNRFAALGIEFGDAIFFNILFAAKSEFLLHCEFNRKAVTIPTCTTGNVVSLHRSVTREDILEYARFNVVGTGHAIGSRGTFVKDPARTVGCLFQAPLKNAFALPHLENPVFKGGQVNMWGYGAVHGEPFGRSKQRANRRDEIPSWC